MKSSLLTLLVLCSTLLSSPAAEPSVPGVSETTIDGKDVYPRWSILGEWKVTHPSWTDVLTLRDDGTISTKELGTSGRWVLTAENGTPLLVLRWTDYGTESLLMVHQNHFRGQIEPGSYMDMRRGEEGRR